MHQSIKGRVALHPYKLINPESPSPYPKLVFAIGHERPNCLQASGRANGAEAHVRPGNEPDGRYLVSTNPLRMDL